MTEPTGRKLTGAEEKAQVRRDNAFRELAITVNKIQAPMLNTGIMELLSRTPTGDLPVKVVVHIQPASVSEMVGQLMHKEKQLEIALNVLTTMILEKNLVNLEEFMNRCAQDAENTSKLMMRGLLSQTPAAGSIIRRQ